MNPLKLREARECLDRQLADAKHRVAIVRRGYLVAEWARAMKSEDKIAIASANKSLLASMLGIAIAEEKIESADDLAVDYYPEMMDVPEGEGPKAGRWAFDKDRKATLRHLICNVSGYMKPGEEPGTVFHYQTHGMCVLSHAIEKSYGLYDVNDAQGAPKISPLYKEKIADPIGARWDYVSSSLPMHDKARLQIFGWGSGILTTLEDFARVGWLWCNRGGWDGRPVIPESWMREVTRVAPDIIAKCPANARRYGHGFWTNEDGRLWPELPRDGFTSWGGGGHYTVIFPSHELVIAMNPTPFPGPAQPYETTTAVWLQQQEVLKLIVGACED